MTNLTISKIAGTTIVEATAAEFVACLMDKKSGVTVPVLEAELTALGVAFRKKDTKEVKAGLLFDKLSAAGETLVAEPNQKEEVVMNEIKLAEVLKAGGVIKQEDLVVSGFNKQLPTPSVGGRKDLGIYHEAASHKDESALKDMLAQVTAQKDQYMENLKPYELVIDEINFYAETYKEANQSQRRNKEIVKVVKLKTGNVMNVLGSVTVQVPDGYMLVKQWDKNKPNSKGTLGAPVMVPFDGHDINLAKRAFDMRRPLADGNGYLVLSIVEFVDKETGAVSPMSVSLPTEKDDKTGKRYPIFHTADARFIKTKNATHVDQPLHLSDNNANFNAMVSAYVQMYANEFMAANSENNHSHKKDCGNLIRFMAKDGVSDDLHSESKKSRYVQQQVDTTQLSRVGAEQPSAYCPIHDIFVDMEYTMTVNESEQFDRDTELLDSKGNLRKGAFDEIPVSGQWVKKAVLRESIINKVCGNCKNFCGNYQKTQSQITNERVAAIDAGEKKPFISPFFRETAKSKAQAIQTLTSIEGKETWVNQFPYQLVEAGKEVLDMRVLGAGMVVYGSDEIEFEADYVVPVEEFDARHADVMKKINHIFYAAFNFGKLTADQVKYVNELATNKPEDLTADEEKRWDNAINWYKTGIQSDLDAQAARNIVPFRTVFHAGIVTGTKRIATRLTLNDKAAYLVRTVALPELNVEDIMGETMRRAEEGTIGYGLGYEDLRPEEFTRYLDEVAIDYVYNIIVDGSEYSIVGGTDKDKELAAGALQEILQKELTGNFYAFANGDYRDNSYATGIRRSEDPQAALAALKVAPEVKAYLATVCGVSK